MPCRVLLQLRSPAVEALAASCADHGPMGLENRKGARSLQMLLVLLRQVTSTILEAIHRPLHNTNSCATAGRGLGYASPGHQMHSSPTPLQTCTLAYSIGDSSVTRANPFAWDLDLCFQGPQNRGFRRQNGISPIAQRGVHGTVRADRNVPGLCCGYRNVYRNVPGLCCGVPQWHN